MYTPSTINNCQNFAIGNRGPGRAAKRGPPPPATSVGAPQARKAKNNRVE